jgi:hypothetical protein
MTDDQRPDDPKTIDLASERRKRRKATDEGKGRAKPVMVYQTFADIINRTLPAFPVFSRRYYTFEPEPGSRIVLQDIGADVVKIVSDETLVNEIIAYARGELFDFDEMQLTHKQAKEAFAYWRAQTAPQEAPKAFGWPGEAGLTFRRLPWLPTIDASGEATPTWNKLISRMSNGQAFIEWVGSLFYEDSDIQQYVWMRGSGNDGKGCLNRFLERVFGSSYCSKQPPERSDRFWTYGLLGRRLVAFPDCSNHTFVSSGLFLSLTGGDPIDIEAKGKMGFTIKPNCKFIFFSNQRPSLSSGRADQRRVIYCEFQDSAVWEAGFEERLWQEGGHFLGTCIEVYNQRNPNRGPITVDTSEITEWVETLEGEYSDIFSEYFRISWDEAEKDDWVPARGFQRTLMRIFRRERNQVRGFLSWLERTYKVRPMTVRFVTETEKRYKGLVMTKETPMFEM